MLSDHDKALIAASFEEIAKAPIAISLDFYHRLFERAPHLREIFPGDVETQASKLIKLIGMAVGSVDYLDSLVIPLRELGEMHRRRGVTSESFDLVADVLMETFSFHLEEIWCREHETAWRRLYDIMAAGMQICADFPGTGNTADV